MTVTAVPQLIDALVSLGQANLTDVTTWDGPMVSEDPGDHLLVGVTSEETRQDSPSAEAESSWAYAGHRVRNETGDITCVAYSSNGDGDLKTARDAATAIMQALSDALRDDPTVDLPAELNMRAEFGGRFEWVQVKDGNGAAARVVFTVHYQAQV